MFVHVQQALCIFGLVRLKYCHQQPFFSDPHQQQVMCYNTLLEIIKTFSVVFAKVPKRIVKSKAESSALTIGITFTILKIDFVTHRIHK